MAVVEKYGLSVKSPNQVNLPLAQSAGGRVLSVSSGAIAVANGDSINSRLYFGKVPSSAILIPALCVIHHGSLTGVSDFDVGLERNGAAVDIDVLADGLNLTSAGTKSAVASVALADLGKPLWQLVAGLTVDPGVEYDVIGTLKAAASAGADVACFLGYSVK